MNLKDLLEQIVLEGHIDTKYPATLAKRLEQDPAIKAITDDVWQAIDAEIQSVVKDGSIETTLKRQKLIELDDKKSYSKKITLPVDLQPYAMHLSAELETRGGHSETIIPHMTILGEASTRRGTVTYIDQKMQSRFGQEHLGLRILRPESIDIQELTKKMSDEARKKMMVIIAHMWNAAIYNAGQHIIKKDSLPS